MRTLLIIAGSDPSGGAGIQADLKTALDHGVYGMAVLTALTAQNTQGVRGVHAVPPGFVAEQIRAVLDDMPVHAIKLGMLANADIIQAVAQALEGVEAPIVLDPVMVSTSGHRLLDAEAERGLLALAERATVVTPNLPESVVMLGPELPETFVARTGTAMLLKDGHGRDDIVRDLLFQEGSLHRFDHARIETRNTHGTGCTLSSAIASRLALGDSLATACETGIRYVSRLIAASADHDLGSGKGPLLHGTD